MPTTRKGIQKKTGTSKAPRKPEIQMCVEALKRPTTAESGNDWTASTADGAKYGRKTNKTCKWNKGRMPNPEHGCQGDPKNNKDGLNQIFNENIYKDRADAWALTAAISGAHTVGKASTVNSGYEGHWSSADQQGIFNNDHYT